LEISHLAPLQALKMDPWSSDGGPDLLSDDAQKLESVTGETLLRPSRACCGEPLCRYSTELKSSLTRARSQIVVASCRRDVEGRHDGVVESCLSGERSCMISDEH
jgi:hypothetical protein